MKTVFVSWTLVAMSFGCGGGHDKSAEGLVRAWLEAARNGHAEAFRDAMPSQDEIDSWFQCPKDVDLSARFDSPNPDFMSWRGQVVPVATTSLVREEISRDGAVGGCVARVDMALQRMDVTLEGGRVLRLRLIEVDGRFRILGY